jgi:hypothetical protein
MGVEGQKGGGERGKERVVEWIEAKSIIWLYENVRMKAVTLSNLHMLKMVKMLIKELR